ncbi:unnamed protein product [Urochloa humidicola]
MARRTRVLLVLAFAAVALLATCAAGAAAGFSAGAEAMPSLQALRRVEDDASSFVEGEEAAAAYPPRRALYSGGHISYAALAASNAACYGPCPARGQAYSRGCQAIYQCPG